MFRFGRQTVSSVVAMLWPCPALPAAEHGHLRPGSCRSSCKPLVLPVSVYIRACPLSLAPCIQLAVMLRCSLLLLFFSLSFLVHAVLIASALRPSRFPLPVCRRLRAWVPAAAASWQSLADCSIMAWLRAIHTSTTKRKRDLDAVYSLSHSRPLYPKSCTHNNGSSPPGGLTGPGYQCARPTHRLHRTHWALSCHHMSCHDTVKTTTPGDNPRHDRHSPREAFSSVSSALHKHPLPRTSTNTAQFVTVRQRKKHVFCCNPHAR